MRWLTLLLCLLIVSALRWLVGSAEPPATTAQDHVVLPKTQSSLEAVNTGSNATPTPASMGTQHAAWINCEPRSAAIDGRPQLANTILSRTNRLMEFEFIEMDAGRMIENPLSTSDRA